MEKVKRRVGGRGGMLMVQPDKVMAKINIDKRNRWIDKWIDRLTEKA